VHPVKRSLSPLLPFLAACALPPLLAAAPDVPDWALPGSATHTQVPPPAGFHRASRNVDVPARIGVFEGMSDIGGAVVPGASSYDDATGRYALDSAGYNIWYNRDEFRYLWKRMSGDVSFAATVTFPNPGGYGDRKAVLVIRQDLDDDSKEGMVALHGAGLIHLALRPDKNANIREAYRMSGTPGGAHPMRIGIEKHGDSLTLWVSLDGEPMHQAGPAAVLHVDAPFYVGIGFCSHLPATSDTAVLSDVVLGNAAGGVR
jgi:hypothetical protein